MAVIKTIQESSLTALGDAIRAKGGTSDLLEFPTGMIDAINNIETGGGGADIEPIVLTGDCSYACSGSMGGKYIELFGDKITTENVTNCSDMFHGTKIKSIPFEINANPSASYVSMKYMFAGSQIEEPPVINNATAGTLQYMFQNSKVRFIPDEFCSSWNWTYMQNNSSLNVSYLFSYCSYLRHISEEFLKNIFTKGTSSGYVPYNNLCEYCVVLDEIKQLAVQNAALTSNRCSGIATYATRLKDLTFVVNDDGTPKTANWKSQTIELSTAGYSSSIYKPQNYGIDASKEVKDDATYQALKDDPDWFSLSVDYSRYNHDSAVNTINSLPDTSAYGTNTIKFKGAAGSKTDGGAINTLTEEEIAVATAKGWTITFV